VAKKKTSRMSAIAGAVALNWAAIVWVLNLIVFLAGLGLFAAGAHQIYPPAALIGPGVVLMVISLFGDRKQ